jgi:hypothetical protein
MTIYYFCFFLNQGTNTLVLAWYALKATPFDRRDCSSVAGIPVTFSNRYRITTGLIIARNPHGDPSAKMKYETHINHSKK